jgi:hypothetical protein
VLERAILTQDPALDLEPVGGGRRAVADAQPDRTVLVLPSEEYRLDELLAVAEPLAMLPGRELLIARLLPDEVALAGAASAMNARRAALQAPTRVATFTTHEPADDVVRLAATYGVELVLLDAPAGLDADQVPDLLAAILERSPADVAVLSGAMTTQSDAGVFVPFGGGENDWAALELGAWLASATGAPLRLIGSKADPRRARRDASRMLADASLAVQRLVRVESEPLLVEPTEEALAVAVEPAGLVVFGISPRWQVDGLGASRRALIRRAWPPVLLVHRGPRPSGLSPRGSRTRFSWTVEDQAAVSQ